MIAAAVNELRRTLLGDLQKVGKEISSQTENICGRLDLEGIQRELRGLSARVDQATALDGVRQELHCLRDRMSAQADHTPALESIQRELESLHGRMGARVDHSIGLESIHNELQSLPGRVGVHVDYSPALESIREELQSLHEHVRREAEDSLSQQSVLKPTSPRERSAASSPRSLAKGNRASPFEGPSSPANRSPSALAVRQPQAGHANHGLDAKILDELHSIRSSMEAEMASVRAAVEASEARALQQAADDHSRSSAPDFAPVLDALREGQAAAAEQVAGALSGLARDLSPAPALLALGELRDSVDHNDREDREAGAALAAQQRALDGLADSVRQARADVEVLRSELSPAPVLTAVRECQDASSIEQVLAELARMRGDLSVEKPIKDCQDSILQQVRAEFRRLQKEFDPLGPIQQCKDSIVQQVVNVMHEHFKFDKTCAAVKECQKTLGQLVRTEIANAKAEQGSSALNLMSAFAEQHSFFAEQAKHTELALAEIRDMGKNRQHSASENLKKIHAAIESVRVCTEDVRSKMDFTPVLEAVDKNRASTRQVLDAVRAKPHDEGPLHIARTVQLSDISVMLTELHQNKASIKSVLGAVANAKSTILEAVTKNLDVSAEMTAFSTLSAKKLSSELAALHAVVREGRLETVGAVERVSCSVEALKSNVDFESMVTAIEQNRAALTPILDSVANVSSSMEVLRESSMHSDRVLQKVEQSMVDLKPVLDAVAEVPKLVQPKVDFTPVLAAVEHNRTDLRPVMDAVAKVMSSIERVNGAMNFTGVLAAVERNRVDLKPVLDALAKLNSCVEGVRPNVDLAPVLDAVKQHRVDLKPVLDELANVSVCTQGVRPTVDLAPVLTK
jgi:hypothetical protein